MERTVDPVDDLSNIVDILISEIQNKVNSAPAIFNLWFGGLRLISLTEKKATFVTPTLLRKNILTMSYKETIEQTLEEILSYHAEVEILTEAENKSEPKPSPVPSEIEDDIDEDILKEGKDFPITVAYYRKRDKLYIVDRPIMLSELFSEGATRQSVADKLCARCNELGQMPLDENGNPIENAEEKEEATA